VTYIREGKTKTTKATLKNQYLTTEIVTASSTFELEGAVLEPVSETLKNQHKIKAGVQVKSLEKGKWKDAGIESGFIITEIDQRPIVNRDDMESALRAAKDQGVLIEGIYPNGEKAYYGIGW
jgi:serine protease Do